MPDDMSADRSQRRKDRLIQTRVARDLESTLKREARRRRLTVSHLIRNVLEDTFQLVDDVVDGVDEIVTESVQLARRVGRDAQRMADAVREAVTKPEIDPTPPDEEALDGDSSISGAPDPDAPDLSHVYAWSGVVANRAEQCARCDVEIARGREAFVGLSDDPSRARTWLCVVCREVL